MKSIMLASHSEQLVPIGSPLVCRMLLGLGLEQFLSVDPGIELGLTVFVTSRRYRQTNSAQALK